jgi:acetylornithine deacetylase/succinyl-diaminopimelate desuccinylase-like protein
VTQDKPDQVSETGTVDTVATTGLFEIRPNTVNSVPREAKLEIDVRDIDKARRDRVVSRIVDKIGSISKARGVESSYEIINQDPPATCDDQVPPRSSTSQTPISFFSAIRQEDPHPTPPPFTNPPESPSHSSRPKSRCRITCTSLS